MCPADVIGDVRLSFSRVYTLRVQAVDHELTWGYVASTNCPVVACLLQNLYHQLSLLIVAT
jgi:hypothetical protein